MTTAQGDWEAIITAVVDQDHPGDPDVALLARHVKARLRRQGMSVLAASEYGILSRSTLTAITQGADRVPSYRTLSKLDDLLSWEFPLNVRSVSMLWYIVNELERSWNAPVEA